MRDSRDREILKERVRRWMGISRVDGQKDAFDMLIMELFFYIYYKLESGEDIREIGNDLGVFPLP